MPESLREFLRLQHHDRGVDYDVIAEEPRGSFHQLLIRYVSTDGDSIPAYLLLPTDRGPHAAVLVHHQHHGERHLGKSEVAGLRGDPLQAFGPALASRGLVVLAPDSICFEDRRKHARGTEPGEGGQDAAAHFNEMAYRLVRGDTLMRKVLDDAAVGLSLLRHHPGVARGRVGVMGHSYGGSTALFQAAVDDRISFACTSGAACTYAHKMARGTGLEMSLIVPGFHPRFDLEDVARAVCPRELLIVSAEDDKYSQDAEAVYRAVHPAFAASGAAAALQHRRFAGGHALTRERFEFIVDWLARKQSPQPHRSGPFLDEGDSRRME